MNINSSIAKQKIAIIGSGISGLTCAYYLKHHYDVFLFESESQLGGHTHTHRHECKDGVFNIDLGFIVFNNWNYPNFTKLIDQLGLKFQDSEMSFSVFNRASGFEYNGHSLNTLFSQRSNLFRPKFWLFIKEILRFNRLAKQHYQLKDKEDINLKRFLDKHNFSSFFRHHYILPMGSAIWSMTLDDMDHFPLNFFVRFFYHHGLLNLSHRPQWYTLEGGSSSYIHHMIEGINPNQIHLNHKAVTIGRQQDKVNISFDNNANEVSSSFDKVILACHSDQALSSLSDATSDETMVLSNIPYQPNEVVLHQDDSLMPKRARSWASWNYPLMTKSSSAKNASLAGVTYYMNRLQNFPADAADFFVSLNQTASIDSSKIIKKVNFSHPVFNPNSSKAQQQKQLICGKNNTFFAGAYWHNGFHEDGVKSALDVCTKLGVTV